MELHKICHQAIHALLSEAELARDFSTVDALRAHPALARFIAWVKKRPAHYQDRSRWSRARRRP
ncbi:HNH endonuclease [Dongia rigui]|uniref:HNH endonuclease n=1 Tax=Dongia rigui TaxID=940149 RepID=A0ABU5DZ85_9PROT|nr:HNH endonuclease [Dongia rigui]MDY0871861.1 HNH endonuclease [Dongia rigui]